MADQAPGSGLLARLKHAVFGNSAPDVGPVDPDFIDSVNSWRFWETFKDRPDEEKIAAIALAAKLYQMPGEPLCPTDQIARVAARLKSLDRNAARIVFGFAAANYLFCRHLKLNALAGLMERQPPGTFDDAELRRDFERIKHHLRTNDRGHDTRFAASEVARRITATVTSPQPAPAVAPAWSAEGFGLVWSAPVVPGIATLSRVGIGPGQTLVDFLRALRSAKPPARWSERAAELAAGPQGSAIRQAIIAWLATLPISGSMRDRFMPDATDPAMLSEVASVLARGAVWMLANWRDAETVATLQTTAETTLLRLSDGLGSVNYRSLTAGNACILVLGEIATSDAVQALGQIKLKVRDERLSKQIAAAMEAAASRARMTIADLQELAVPNFALDEVGVKNVSLGDVTAALRVRSTSDVTVEFIRADGKTVKAVPASVKADPAASARLKDLKAAAKSIAEALPVHRQRIESAYLTRRTWPLAVWRERFLDHLLVGTLARRLIWTVTSPEGDARSVIWYESRLVDAAGAPATGLRDDCAVTLWHPVEATGEDVAAWRAFLIRHKVVQPFKQAHRELYPLTDAERAMHAYSNRFAGHILRQHQGLALARLRGWRATMRICADGQSDEPIRLAIPDFDLAAELWIEPAGGKEAEITDSQTYVFMATDRVRFRAFLGAGDGSRALGDPVPLDEIPPRIFSEVMRDVGLVVGIASIGNDPAWIDRGADAAHPSLWRRTAARDYWNSQANAALDVAGESRRQLLAELLPSLAIADRCTLPDRHLAVRGRLREYRIHLGSGQVLMESERYLYIDPAAAKEGAIDDLLPFEGDPMLAQVLAKAVMLAADDKITDPGILAQLRT